MWYELHNLWLPTEGPPVSKKLLQREETAAPIMLFQESWSHTLGMHQHVVNSLPCIRLFIIYFTQREAGLPPDASDKCLLAQSPSFFMKHWPDLWENWTLSESHTTPATLMCSILLFALLSLDYNTYPDNSQNNKRWLLIYIVFADHVIESWEGWQNIEKHIHGNLK